MSTLTFVNCYYIWLNWTVFGASAVVRYFSAFCQDTEDAFRHIFGSSLSHSSFESKVLML